MNLGDDLVGLERRGQRALEEIGGLDGARAGLAHHRDLGVAGLCNAGHLGRPDRRARGCRRRCRGCGSGNARRGRSLPCSSGCAVASRLSSRMSRQRTSAPSRTPSAPILISLQARQLPQIDQQRRLGDAKRHHRHQALAAGQRLGLAVVVGEQRHGLVDGGRAGVFEGRKFHGLCFAPSALRLWNDDRLLSPPRAWPVNARAMQLRYGTAACRINAVWRSRMAVELSLSVCNYDRTAALFDGRAPIEGCDVTAVANSPEESFHRAFKFQEFDVTEISMSSYLLTLSRNDAHYVAIPAFVSRLFRHSGIYVRTDRHQDAGRPQGQDDGPAGIPDDRERLGARHAGGGIRRQAARHQMAARRPGRARPRGARQDHAAAGDRPAAGAGRPHDLRHAGEGRDRRPAQRAGAELLPARRAECRPAVSGLSGGRGGLFQEDQAVSDHARDRHPPLAGREVSVGRGQRLQGVPQGQGAVHGTSSPRSAICTRPCRGRCMPTIMRAR